MFDDPPELVVLDLGLPDIDGLEVCRRLRADHERLPIIMLTARREELDIVEGFEAGADDYMTKPFRLSELLARIRARLRAVTANGWNRRTSPSTSPLAAPGRRTASSGCRPRSSTCSPSSSAARAPSSSASS